LFSGPFPFTLWYSISACLAYSVAFPTSLLSAYILASSFFSSSCFLSFISAFFFSSTFCAFIYSSLILAASYINFIFSLVSFLSEVFLPLFASSLLLASIASSPNLLTSFFALTTFSNFLLAKLSLYFTPVSSFALAYLKSASALLSFSID